MSGKIRYYYYRIYDDKEQFDYIKSSLEEKAVRKLLKKFEATHEEYYNVEFMKLLKQRDAKAELIDVKPISY